MSNFLAVVPTMYINNGRIYLVVTKLSLVSSRQYITIYNTLHSQKITRRS